MNDAGFEVTSEKFLSADYQIVARDVRIERFFVSSAVLKGESWILPASYDRVHCCYSKRSSGELSLQLQVKCSDYLKCVHVVFRQAGNDVVGRADWAAAVPDENIGYDFSSEFAKSDVRRIEVKPNEKEGYGVCRLRYGVLPELVPYVMPVVVYKGGETEQWAATGRMGDCADALKIDDRFRESSQGSPCIKVEYASNDGWAGLYWQDPAGDWGELPGGANLMKANALVFKARGEQGGERVSFCVGGLMNKEVGDTAKRSLENVELTKGWKQYRIDLKGLDLTRIKSAFCFWFEGQGRPIAFYLDDIYYDKVQISAGDIFISYSRKDIDAIEPICESVRKATGADPWIDMKGIETGSQFEDKIMDAIDRCKVFVFLMSKNSMKSPWTRREFDYAMNIGKKVCPVRIDDSRPARWFLFKYGGLDCVDYTEPAQRGKLFRDLGNWVRGADKNEI